MDDLKKIAELKIASPFEGLFELVKWETTKADMLGKIYISTVKGGLFGANLDDIPILNDLFSEGYIEKPTVGITLKLTNIGYTVASSGNYLEILRKKKDLEYKDNYERELEQRLKNAQLITAEFTAKTRYVPLVLSLLAIGISLLALIINYFK